jgi:mono/diheme cytochrome c family protein
MRIGIAIVTAALLAGAALTARAFEAVSLADYSGEELFQRFCSSCHGEAAHGDGPVARTLSVIVPDLTLITRRYGEFPAARIRETIDGRGVMVAAHGTRVMPVWGYEFWVEEGADRVAQDEARATINKLVEYLRSIQAEPERRNR